MARARNTPLPRARVLSPDAGAVVAAAVHAAGPRAEKMQRLLQPWQADALRFYDEVGECWYAAQFYSRALSKLRLYVASRDDQGEMVEVDKGHPATALLDRIQDPSGSRAQLLAAYGRLMFLIGEGRLCVSEQDEIETWEFLSPDELKINPTGGGYTRRRAPSLEQEQLTEEDGEKVAVVYRMWRRHPRWSEWSDSPMRAVLSLFEELSLLQAAVRRRTRSRLAGAGLLYVPLELSFDTTPDDEDEDPFFEDLKKAMTKAIEEPTAASGVVPIVIRGPAEFADAVKKIDVHNANETYQEEGLRSEIIRRIALGLDMPPEVLLGMADANHWSAWQIDEQTWKAHLMPMAQQLVDDLTAAYLRPAAKEANIKNWQNLAVGYDPAEVLSNPDKAKDAKDLYDRGVLSNEALRDAAGFSDDHKPSQDEHDEWLGIKLGEPGLIPGLEPIEPEVDPNADPNAPPGQQKQGEQEDEPPDDEKAKEEQQQGQTAALVLGAAEAAVVRARELAGSRVRTKLGKRRAGEVDGVPNSQVAAVLGEPGVEALGIGAPTALVAGAAVTFEQTAVRLGVSDRMAKKIGLQVEQYAARTLFEQEPPMLPSRFAATVARLGG